MSQPTIVDISMLYKCCNTKCSIIGIVHKIGLPNMKNNKRDILVVDQTGPIVVREFRNKNPRFTEFKIGECSRFTVTIEEYQNEIHGKFIAASPEDVDETQQKEITEWYEEFKAFHIHETYFTPTELMQHDMNGLRINFRGTIEFFIQNPNDVTYHLTGGPNRDHVNIFQWGESKYDQGNHICIRNLRVSKFKGIWQFEVDDLSDIKLSSAENIGSGMSAISKRQSTSDVSHDSKKRFCGLLSGKLIHCQTIMTEMKKSDKKDEMIKAILPMLLTVKKVRTSITIPLLLEYFQECVTSNKMNGKFLTAELYNLVSKVPDHPPEVFCAFIENILKHVDDSIRAQMLYNINNICRVHRGEENSDEDDDSEDDFLSQLVQKSDKVPKISHTKKSNNVQEVSDTNKSNEGESVSKKLDEAEDC